MVGPHGRLSLIWAILTVVATMAGPLWLALWLAATSGLAGAQIARSRLDRPSRSAPDTAMAVTVVGAAAAACVTLSAAFGPIVFAATAGTVLVVSLAYVLINGGAIRTPVRELLLVSGMAVAVGAAGAAPVLLLATSGLIPVLVLFAYAMAYDAGTYVVGSGAASAWEGPAAGIAATGTVTLAVAALLASPFRGSSPWVLGGLAAALAPIGPMLGTLFPGDPRVRVPALRRLDSLMVLGPLWALAATLLLD